MTKAHSLAKGVFTLVPIPKIDVIYAQLAGSKNLMHTRLKEVVTTT